MLAEGRTASSLVAAHREATGDNLFDVRLAAERAGERVVVAGEHWTAFVPEAAMHEAGVASVDVDTLFESSDTLAELSWMPPVVGVEKRDVFSV